MIQPRTLQKFHIRKFYTHDTPYNDSFVRSIPPDIRKNFDIGYIDTIENLKEGYVVVPGTNSCSSIMYDYPVARSTNRKFERDPWLNGMIESKAIRRHAKASFKTFGTSRIWVHEGEVPSYRDLILREITDEDRWRGYAWLLKF